MVKFMQQRQVKKLYELLPLNDALRVDKVRKNKMVAEE